MMITKLPSLLTNSRHETGREIYDRLKGSSDFRLTSKKLQLLEEYCFSDEMRSSGERVPSHIRNLFPGRRIVTTMHIARKPNPLQVKKPATA